MAAGANLDWLFWLLGGLVAAGGTVLGAWALFWDRARRRGVVRKRCPRCWYDMTGAPALTCPECGREAKGERALLRTRRRWKWAIGAAVVIAAGAATGMVPRYRAGGWIGLVPSSVLVWAAPAERPSGPQTVTWSAIGTPGATGIVISGGGSAGVVTTAPGSVRRTVPVGPAGAMTAATRARALRGVPVVQAPLSQRACDAVWKRLLEGRLAGWQSRIFLDRYARAQNAPDLWTVRYLERWPVGEPLRVMIGPTLAFKDLADACETEFRIGSDGEWRRLPAPSPYDWRRADRLIALTALQAGADAHRLNLQFRMKARGRTVYRGSIQLSMTPVPDRASMMVGVDPPELSNAAREALDPALAVDESGAVVLVVNDRSRAGVWDRIDVIQAFDAEVLVDGRVVGRTDGWTEPARVVWKNWLNLPIDWTPGGRERLRAGADRAEIRITGSADRAARLVLQSPFDDLGMLCWTGSFTVPARWGEAWRPPPTERLPP